MWVITVFSKTEDIRMFEFEDEEEARQAFKEMEGCKFLTELVEYQQPAKKNKLTLV